MSDKIQKFLTAAQRLEIENRVKAAESSTSGEIVVMAVGASSTYPAATITGGGTFALLLALAASVLLRSEHLWLFLTLFALFFIAAHEIVKRVPVLKRPFVSRREMAEEVDEAVLTSFYSRNVHETRDRTGILIYVSLFEHRVRVLADKGINAKVGQETWSEIVDMITKGIHEKRQGEAICSAVERCGMLLQSHFPRSGDDRNELGDVMIIGSRHD
ncbi:MAG: hypothetical protein HGB29_05555 [Chlorobiaceae bacterium]|nr:hypothetical protein [Chlorobiaceae bacterium]NTW74313.1 hypothetical protein [Chlorobiaceae bacterium]